MWDAYPDLHYGDKDGKGGVQPRLGACLPYLAEDDIFGCRIRLSEDWALCRRVTDAGICDIWADMRIRLRHWGVKAYELPSGPPEDNNASDGWEQDE